MAEEPRWEDIFSEQQEQQEQPLSRRQARQDRGRRGRGGQARRAPAPNPPRDARHRSRAWIGWVVAFVVTLGLIGGGAAFAWANFEPQIRQVLGWELPPPDYVGQGSGEASVVINSGDSGVEVTQTLLDAGVIKSFDAFYSLLLSQDPPVEFYPGYYILAEKMSSQAALEAIQDPSNKVEDTALIPEGKTAHQIFEILSASTGLPLEEFEAAAQDLSAFGIPETAPNIEGYLFPATYRFDPGVTVESILTTLVDRTFQALDEAGAQRSDWNRVLTIASLIQREAGSNQDDFYKVSRVIQNRLDKGMRLQFDSTSHYGYVWKHGARQDGGVFSTSAELRDDNPYNTYVITGLPAGPIAAVGDLAIDAALHPATGPWLYFVTVNLDTGETVFSETHAQHNAAVRQLQQWCRSSQSPNCD